ncbi:MAG: glutamine-hydrolyzing GMP synthase [Deltaproteobacteria bacterium]|nr:glutamine-hydrolyzing GMP synthase [Deltaproteobacteria bacterium]
MANDLVLILDFGSQTTQLIARRVREIGVYCEIWPFTSSIEKIKAAAPGAIILSGGPASVHQGGSPRPDKGIWTLGVPMLGICYGMQVMVEEHDGQVLPAAQREFGRARVDVDEVAALGLFKGLGGSLDVWMSHGDQVSRLPSGFNVIGKSDTCPAAAVVDASGRMFGVQFHPEVVHTPQGKQLLESFVIGVAGLHKTWKMDRFVDEKVKEIKKTVGDQRVLMAISGGVDSSVAATLIHRAIGDKLTAVYVDHGLHRQGEIEQVRSIFKDGLKMDVRIVDASERFFAALEGVIDPETKRKRIGHVFIDVFDDVARGLTGSGVERVGFLGQGTLYPDVIESVSVHGGPSAVIKSHHNVGGLPERMSLKLLEPLRELFKDEVRVLGRELHLADVVVDRQPFPGPGLAIRVLGEVTRARCELLKKADAIVRHEIDDAVAAAALIPDGFDTTGLWQWFAVLLPVKSVGVMGDARTYDETVCVRCVRSTDGMTADWVDLPHAVLSRISNRIINEVRGVNRVVYDISSKPPATIEWE